jgi:hypothetical protein
MSQKLFCIGGWFIGLTAIAVGCFVPPFNTESALCILTGAYVLSTTPRWR